MSYSFGQASAFRLKTCNVRLQVVLNVAIKCTEIDFSVIDGFRDEERQNQYFAAGKSKALWLESPHNFGYAVDVYPYPVDWDNMKPFYYLGGLITGIASAHGIPVEWAGLWQSFPDAPHFQLSNWKDLIEGGKDSYSRHKENENG